jgi:hypothetical protein
MSINVNEPSNVTSALNLLVLIYLLHVSAHRPSSERYISFSMKRTFKFAEAVQDKAVLFMLMLTYLSDDGLWAETCKR